MLTLITQNPELKRYKWLELRTNKIIILFIIIFLIYITAYSLEWTQVNLKDVSIVLFHFLVTLWGSREIAAALPDEVNEKTWDRQCMTGLSPMKLSIGKLIGPALFQWCGGIAVISIGLFSTLAQGNGVIGVIEIVNTVLIGVLFNMMALMSGLIVLAGERLSSFSNKKIKTGFFILFMVIIYSIFSTFFKLLGWNSLLSELSHNPEVVIRTYWYYFGFNASVFQLFTLVFFCSWLMVGIYQSMRRELKYINTNQLLWLFISTTIIYFFGLGFNPFFNLHESILLGWFSAAAFIFIITYFLLISERESIIEVKKTFSKNPFLLFNKPENNSPAWQVFTISSLLLFFAGVILISTFNLENESTWTSLMKINFGDINYKTQSISFLCCIILLLLRDLYITRYINYFSNFNNRQLAIFIYFALVYGLLPLLLKAGSISMLFLPINFNALYITIGSLMVQAVLAAAYFGSELKKNFVE